ncbi:MAG: DinB family protein [Blastocatellia bacterium]|nr:DinB family protein [Blastocatellia bacterium]
MSTELVETWNIHDRINRYLLDSLPGNALGCVSASKGRTVGEQFAHIHNVRLMWLKQAAPALLDGLSKLEKGAVVSVEDLSTALEASGAAIAQLIADRQADGSRVKGFKPHTTAFVGYLISHESHHRGQIVLTLKQAGHPVDKKTAFGLWEWGSR